MPSGEEGSSEMRSNTLISLSPEKICNKSSKFFGVIVEQKWPTCDYFTSKSMMKAITIKCKWETAYIFIHSLKNQTERKDWCVNYTTENFENSSFPDRFG